MKKISLIFAFVILAVAMFAFNIFAGNVTKDDVVASGTMSGGGGVHHTQLGTKMFDGVTDCGGVYGWTGDAWYGSGASNHSITIKFNNTIELSSFAFHGISQNGSFKIEGLLNNAVVFTKTASLASGDSAYGKVEVIKLSEGLSYNVDAIKFTVVSAGNGGRYKISEFEIHKCEYVYAGVKQEKTCVQDGISNYVCDCGRTKEVVDKATGEHSLKFNDKYEVQPSCGQAGTAIWECENCDYTETRTVGATGDHVYTEFVATVNEPTCVTKGLETRRCSCGAESDVETDATGIHNYSEFVDYVTEPTCVGTGVANYKCATCDATTPKTVDPTGIHVYSVSQDVTPPKCVQGYTTYKCANCDATEKRDFTDAIYEHNFNLFRKTTKLPTREEEGAMEYVCQACYSTTSVPIPKLECGALVNIAGWATLEHKQGNWISGGELVGDWRITAPRLVDGNYGTGIGSSHGSAAVSIFLNFDRAYVFEEIVVYVNQTAAWGDAVSQDTNLTNLVSGKNQNFNFAICYYDANGEKIAEHWFNTLDQQRIVVPGSDVPVAKIEYWNPCSYNNNRAVWEIEAFAVPAEHTKDEAVEGIVTAPTCTADGYTTYKCAVCGADYNGDVIRALGHEMGNYTIKTPATCTQGAVIEFACARNCGEILEKDMYIKDVTDFGDFNSIKTENAGGNTSNQQAMFDNNWDTFLQTSDGHYHKSEITLDMPYYISSATIWIGQGNENDALMTLYYMAPGGTEWLVAGTKQVPPTLGIQEFTLELETPVLASAIRVYVEECYSHSTKVWEVEVAGSLFADTVPNNHSWVAGETVAPTCVTNGYTNYTCSVCQETKIDTYVMATGIHTCSANYNEENKNLCAVCGNTYAADKVTHTWADATCTAPKTCSVCGATEGEALGQHIYDLSNAVTDGNVITIACTNGCGAAATITVNGTKAQAGFNMMMQQAVVSVYAPGYGMLSATTSEGSSCFLITNPRLPAQSFTAPMIVNIDGFNDTYVIVPQFSSTDAAPSITITYEALTPATIVEGENTVDTSKGDTKVQFVVVESGKYNFVLNADAVILTEYGSVATCEGPFEYEAGDVVEIIVMPYGAPSIDIAVEKIVEHTHTPVEIPAVRPTPSTQGYTAGVKCSECDETIKAPVAVTLEKQPNGSGNTWFRFTGAYLSLQESISVKYDAVITEGYNNVYAVFVFNGEEYLVERNGNSLVFKFTELLPQHMNLNIEAYLYAETGEGAYAYNVVPKYSVKQYCLNMLKTAYASNDTKLITIISNVLAYGAAVQEYTGYVPNKESEYITAIVGESYKLTPNVFTDTSASKNVQANTGDKTTNTNWCGVGLTMGSNTVVTIDFKTDNIEGLAVKINIGGKDTYITEFTKSGDVYTVVIDFIWSSQYEDVISASFERDGEPISSTFTYSINSYCVKHHNNANYSERVRKMIKALYVYGESVKAYFAK